MIWVYERRVFMGLAKKFIKEPKDGRKRSANAFIIAGLLFIALGAALFWNSEKIKSDCVETNAVISRIGMGKHKNRAYVDYEYNGTLYSSALNYFNKFTMKEEDAVTVYIDPLHPEIPKVPTYGSAIFVTAFGAVFAVCGVVEKKRIGKKDKE